MDDLHLIQAVEKYISGSMTPDERVYFEQLRKSNPEVDQLVVEHTFFMQQLNRFDETKKIKSQLNDIHIDLAEKGLISSTRLQGKAKIIYLYKRYKRVAAIAASIAGITTIAIASILWAFSSGKPAEDYTILNGKIERLEHTDKQLVQNDRALAAKLNTVTTEPSTAVIYTDRGTGFLVDAQGYIATNAHIVKGKRNIAVQSADNKEMAASVVYVDEKRDLAILKINDPSFKLLKSLPYGIKSGNSDVAESIYTLGFPRNDMVYGEGYLAARTGFKGDTLACQIAIPANPGNSGGPVFNRHGEIIGILTGKQNSVEGAVFAVQSKYILEVIAAFQNQSGSPKLKVPSTSALKGTERSQQVKKISDFVYMVKVS